MDSIGLTNKEKIELMIDNKIFDIHTSVPAIITNVNYSEQTLDAQISVNPIATIGGSEKILKYPELRSIPFYTIQNSDFFITIPPKIGDTCLLIFCERNCDQFWNTGEVSAPIYAKRRKHNINDSVALVGWNPTKKKIPNYQNNEIEIRNKQRTLLVGMNDKRIQIVAGKSSAYLDNDLIKITNQNSDIEINAQQIVVKHGDHSIAITDNGIQISSNRNVSVIAQDITVNAKNSMTLKASNISMNASSTAINSGSINLNGAVHVSGDLDVTTINSGPYPPPRKQPISDSNDATQGYLWTGILDEWSIFIDEIPMQGFEFEINAAKNLNTIAIDYNLFFPTDPPEGEEPIPAEIQSYSELCARIQDQSADLFTCSYNEEENRILFVTSGAGDDAGYIEYLHNITDDIGATSGILYTGEFPEFEDFLNSLNSKGIAFKINCGGEYVTYTLLYSDISTLSSFEGLVDGLNQQSDKLQISFDSNINKIKFETVGTGKYDGYISYLYNTDTSSSPAEFYSGTMQSYQEFVSSLGQQDFAVQNIVNDNQCIYFASYSDITEYKSFEDFFSKVFTNDYVRGSFDDLNSVGCITTKTFGASNHIGFFSAVSEIPAQQAYLVTGGLPEFQDVKTTYSQGESNINFYIKLDNIRYDYSITPDDLISAVSWSDISNILNSQQSRVDVTYQDASFVFVNTRAEECEISYLMHDDSVVGDINGATLLAGTERYALAKVNGTDANTNIAQHCEKLLKLTQDTGAKTIDGADDQYNSNSSILLMGVKEKGAILTYGADGQVVTVNNSATILKGTQETGAQVSPGNDSGEIPVDYDGVVTILGDMHISKTLKARNIEATHSLDATGNIEFNPLDMSTVDPTVSDVTVNGGIVSDNLSVQDSAKINSLTVDNNTRTKSLDVSDIATVNQLVVNDGVEITGDLAIDSGKIKSNGTTLSFEGDGMHSSKNIYAPDVYVND